MGMENSAAPLLGQKPKFPMGTLVWTRGVNERIADDEEFAK